jgi:hypothetical protein
MKKLIILIFFISPTILFSQKRLDISIRFDNKIDVSKLYSNYHNGYRDIDFKDSIINNEIKIKDYFINEEVPFFVVIISFDNLYFIYILSSIFVFISFIIEKNIKLYFQLISIIINLITIGIIFYLSNKQYKNQINYIEVFYNPQTYVLFLLFFFNTYKILNKIKST